VEISGGFIVAGGSINFLRYNNNNCNNTANNMENNILLSSAAVTSSIFNSSNQGTHCYKVEYGSDANFTAGNAMI